jgi:hypothetical protein
VLDCPAVLPLCLIDVYAGSAINSRSEWQRFFSPFLVVRLSGASSSFTFEQATDQNIDQQAVRLDDTYCLLLLSRRQCLFARCLDSSALDSSVAKLSNILDQPRRRTGIVSFLGSFQPGYDDRLRTSLSASSLGCVVGVNGCLYSAFLFCCCAHTHTLL